jgi:hypothetical protein
MRQAIHFRPGEPTLADFRRQVWADGEQRLVEFFDDQCAPVSVLDIGDPALPAILARLRTESPLILDLEWFAYARVQVISLYQICSPSGVLCILDRSRFPSHLLSSFLDQSSGNRFIGKGIDCDIQMLLKRYGSSFVISMEDIQSTRFASRSLSENFDKMVANFAGPPLAQFKDKKVTMSRWDAPQLSIEQILYAAFDVYAIFVALPNFPTPLYSRITLFYEPASVDFQAQLITYMIENGLVKDLHCNVCNCDIDDVKLHVWDIHSEELCKLMKWRTGIVVRAMASMFITPSGKLKTAKGPCLAFFDILQETESHTEFLNQPRTIKSVFLEFLQRTGRVHIAENKCLICEAVDGNLESHVWTEHWQILSEWIEPPPVEQKPPDLRDVGKLILPADCANAALRLRFFGTVKNPHPRRNSANRAKYSFWTGQALTLPG